jgi:hypothetical protein
MIDPFKRFAIVQGMTHTQQPHAPKYVEIDLLLAARKYKEAASMKSEQERKNTIEGLAIPCLANMSNHCGTAMNKGFLRGSHQTAGVPPGSLQ